MRSLLTRVLLLPALLAALPAGARAQAGDTAATAAAAPPVRLVPAAVAVRAAVAPQIDGRLDDEAWAAAPVIDAFVQRDPVEGAPASERTEVRIVYDDGAIYVGARLHDRRPVTSRLGRRDMVLGGSDWFRMSFDSYRDRRSAFRFDVNPAGVRRDAVLGPLDGGFGGGGFAGPEGDLAWDAVWQAAARVDPGGWTVEVRIPLSQLRFAPAEEQLWGVQLERIIDRTQELALFSFTRKSEPGGIPAFGDLRGMRGVRPRRQLELVPYALSQGTFAPGGAPDLAGRRGMQWSAGVDVRYGITSNLTLTATVNPDFGQVEVDPAVINLSAFETRLEEKRPFFVEGASGYRFGGNVLGPGGNAATLLYSRRIGRDPQVTLPAEPLEVPRVTDILGAAKLSGKTSGGWSVGVLNAVTREEHGRYVDAQGVLGTAVVEPGTNYFVGRVNREMRHGRSAVGGMATSVTRDVSDPRAAAALRSDAYTAGVDFTHEWARGGWLVGGFLVGSHVRGSEAAIRATQRAATRYFQRPDSERLGVDAGLTSLAGYASTVQVRKPAGKHWTGDLWVGTISPGFEINDLGFLQRTDRTGTGGMIRYTERRPGRLLRTWSVNASQNFARNFDGDWIEKIVRTGGSVTLLNYWTVDLLGMYEPERFDDRLTRGGPLARRPAARIGRVVVGSDPRRSVIGNATYQVQDDRAGGTTRTVQATAAVRRSPQWNLSVGPRIQTVREDAQYVATVADPTMAATFGARYVFAPLKQTELSVVTRLNWTFTPDLSFELYAQPLVSNGEYGAVKEFAAPGSYRFAEYGRDVGTVTRTGRRYTVDPDGAGPAPAFTVADRSFTRRSLRGNAVLRWEYRPGSTVYMVWQQDRASAERMDVFETGRALGSILDAPASNVLVLKWTYWFNP
jgi:hypothetical protein